MDASYNKLETLCCIFRSCIDLEVINLEFNHLSSIDNKTFNYSNHLREINLSWNNLLRLDGNLFLDLNRLEKVSIKTFIQTKFIRRLHNILCKFNQMNFSL